MKKWFFSPKALIFLKHFAIFFPCGCFFAFFKIFYTNALYIKIRYEKYLPKTFSKQDYWFSKKEKNISSKIKNRYESKEKERFILCLLLAMAFCYFFCVVCGEFLVPLFSSPHKWPQCWCGFFVARHIQSFAILFNHLPKNASCCSLQNFCGLFETNIHWQSKKLFADRMRQNTTLVWQRKVSIIYFLCFFKIKVGNQCRIQDMNALICNILFHRLAHMDGLHIFLQPLSAAQMHPRKFCLRSWFHL